MSTPQLNVLLAMIRADLELAWEHLENGCADMALHEVDNAREKILQVRAAKAAMKETQITLLDLTPTNEQIHGTGTTPAVHSRET